MSRFFIALIVFSLLFLIIEFYAFQALKTITNNKYVKIIWVLAALAIYINLFYTLYATPRSAGQTIRFQLAAGFLLTFLIPKLVIVIMMFGEDAVRVVQKTVSFVSPGTTQPIASRRLFVSQLALVLAAIPFTSFLYGIFQGKYNYKVLKYQLSFEDLPEAFDGFTITQISDIHSGSFTNPEKINVIETKMRES
jgi:cytochrome bd-type quinol oxidase subunit 2